MRLIANLIAQIFREDYRAKKYFRKNLRKAHVNKIFDKNGPTLLTSFVFFNKTFINFCGNFRYDFRANFLSFSFIFASIFLRKICENYFTITKIIYQKFSFQPYLQFTVCVQYYYCFQVFLPEEQMLIFFVVYFCGFL
jgi:hypothetical protein